MRRRLSIATAGLGAVLMLAFALGSPAAADTEPLPVYDAGATGQGLVGTAAIKPSILESAIAAGMLFASTDFTSQGGGISRSLSAPVYPGGAAIGALTPFTSCGGLKGWVEARYPATAGCPGEQNDFYTQVSLDQVSSVTGRMRAAAGLARGTSSIAMNDLVLRPSADDPPILRIGALMVANGGARATTLVENASEIVAEDIRLLNDAVVIGSMISRARTTSNGTVGTAEASVTYTDVSVTIDGERHDAVITNEGIIVQGEDRDIDLGLTETISDELLQAGITISAATPVEITEGASGEAAAPGLSITFSTVLPSVPIPAEGAAVLGPVIEQIPTKCLFELTHDDTPDQLDPATEQFPRVPLCFGAGVLPGGGSKPSLTLTIASAASRAVALSTPGFEPPTLPEIPTNPPAFGPLPPSAPFTPSTPVSPGQIAGQPVPQVPVAQQPLVGLVARLPDAALAWAGLMLLILAFGLAVAPSLRDGRAS